MRRAMMTNRPFGGAPFTVGNPATNRANNYASAGVIIAAFDSPAPRAGTITSASVYAGTAGTGYFVTGTYDGSNIFTVTATTALLTTAVGVNTFTVSLPIANGGNVAWYQSSGGIKRDTSGGSSGTISGSAPTAGATYAVGAPAGSKWSIEGTGS